MAATEIQQGTARIFGMDSSGTAASIDVTATGAAYVTIESGDWEHQYDVEEIKGQNGEVETLIAHNERHDLTVQFAPSGDVGGVNDKDTAILSAVRSVAPMITKVTLANFAISTINGDYNALPGTTMRLTRENAVVMTLKLRKYVTNNGALTAGAIVQTTPP